jgi:ribosomal protein S18 acetylase RimI-like enzyme
METHREWTINDDLRIAMVDNIPENIFQRLMKENVLNGHPALNWQSELNEIEKEKHELLKDRMKNRFRLKLVILYDEEIVGLTSGWQLATSHDYYMGISSVKSEFRKRGLYSRMLDIVLAITEEEGFSTVKSRHINTNAPVLIAKLKKGFLINGFEIDDSMGALLTMTYYHNNTRKNAAYYRSGKIDEVSTEKLLKRSIQE